MITKNILYKYFKDFADNHLQIKDYGYGDLWEISSSQATTYPLFWVSPQPSNISGNEITYNFNILIGDRLEDGDANKVEVESDTFQIGLDLLATLNLNRDVDLDKSNTLTPFIHDFKDRIAGHLITVSVTADFDYNECAVPTTGTPTPPTSSCPVAIITINGVSYGSVGSGNTEDIAVVDGSGTPVGSLVSGNWVVVASCPNASAVLKNSAGTTISTTSIASGASSNIVAPDSSAVLKDTAGTTISTTAILSGGSSNITAPDGSAVLKNTLNTTLSTTSILSNGSSNITAPDSTAVIKDDSGNILKTSVIPSNVSQDVTINDSTAVLKNTLATTLSTTSINAESSANITAPDSTITINSASFFPYASGATSNILVKDGTGTQVGSKVGSEWIVPTGGSSFNVGLVDRFGNTLPTQSVSSNTTWDLRTLTPFDYADIYLSKLSSPSVTIQNAIIQLVDDLNAANIWDDFFTIHPFVNGNANDHALNLKYPFRTTNANLGYFIGSPTHNANGITTNGSNGMVIPISADVYANGGDRFGMSIYSRTDGAAASNLANDMGGCLGLNNEQSRIFIRSANNNQLGSIGGTGDIYYTPSYTGSALGLFSTIVGTTVDSLTRNGVILGGTVKSPTAQPKTYGVSIGGLFNNQTLGIIWGVARNYAYASTQKALTITQEANHYTAVQTFQTALSRQV